MLIGVEGGCLGVRDERLKVGVYNVVKNLLMELGKIDKNNQYLLYSFEPIEENLMVKFGKNFKNIVVRPSKGWMKIWLPLRMFFDKPDVFLALNQSIPGFFGLRSQNDKAGRMKTIGFIYDVAFNKFPQMYVPSSVPKMKQNTKNLVNNANYLICISEWTKNELIKLYKVNESKIQVEYPGVSLKNYQSDQTLIDSEPGFPIRSGMTRKILNQVQHDKYFLFVGALKKSKNIPSVIKAFAEFLKKTKKNYYLYLAGGDKWVDPEIDRIISNLDVKDRVKILGYVNNDELIRLYKNAIAFVSPSLYEGFGLTLVEAMSCGCPVIAGKNGAEKEVIKDAGILVDPENVNEITKAMVTITNNKELRAKLIETGLKRASLFSWESFAKTVFKKIKEYEHKTN